MKQFVMPRKWINIIGLAGFGLLLIVFAIYVVMSIFAWYVKIFLGVGLAGVLAFWVLNALTSRMTRYGSNVAVMILLAFAILVLVNFVSAKHFKRADTTQGRIFSLSEQTDKILKGLAQEVKITAFYSETHYRRRVAEDILNEYAEKSDRIHFTLIDPASKPGLAREYIAKQNKIKDFNGVVIFEIGDKREYVQSYQNEEQDFTSAILKLLSTNQKKVYFLDGHGEKDIDGYNEDSYSDLKKMIEADNYQVEKLILAQKGAIPEDCSVLVIAGPQKPLLPQEEEAISNYLDLGGKAIIMADPTPSPSLENIITKWGVEVHNDIILDAFGQSILNDPRIPVSVNYPPHDITAPLGRIITFFPIARSLAPKKDLPKNLKVEELVKTSPDSYGEVDIETLMSQHRSNPDEVKDYKGPLTLAVAVTSKQKVKKEKTEEEKENRKLVVFGDSDFVANVGMKQGNPDLFMNSLNWLTEDQELISIRPKNEEKIAQIEQLSGKQIRFVSYASIFTIPILLLMIGGWVWWKRR